MNLKMGMVLLLGVAGAAFGATRYEAETATIGTDAVAVDTSGLSGTGYVNMKGGSLTFSTNVATAGNYNMTVHYSEPFDPSGKTQNLEINGASSGSITFSSMLGWGDVVAVVKLKAGDNTVAITNSWGWVKVDYIELAPFVAESFTLTPTLVTAGATANAQKVFQFMRENFQKKVISGVQTLDVLSGMTVMDLYAQTEVSHIKTQSGKYPVVVGFDLMHATGQGTDGVWQKAYSNATVTMATQLFNAGGIPEYTWHWRDPLEATNSFYKKSTDHPEGTTFDFTTACTDATCAAWNTSSTAYQKMIANIDTTARYLKDLQTAGVPILWRPLHEPSGTWFWWGAKGGTAYIALYKLLFDRLTNHHALKNLIWVWNSSGADKDWYPGDAYVDIIGRDYYYWPRVTNHASLLGEFEAIKKTFGKTKMIALSECGSVPSPDEMVADGVGWSYFMPWYGNYTIEGTAEGIVYNDNDNAFWNTLMNHSYVITLADMPGWAKYVLPTLKQGSSPLFHFSVNNGVLRVNSEKVESVVLELINPQGRVVRELYKGELLSGLNSFSLTGIPKGVYLLRISRSAGIHSQPLVIQ